MSTLAVRRRADRGLAGDRRGGGGRLGRGDRPARRRARARRGRVRCPSMKASLIGRDGARYPLDEPRWRGDDGSPLLVEPLPGITRADIEPRRALAVALRQGAAARADPGQPRRRLHAAARRRASTASTCGQARVVQPDRRASRTAARRDGLAARAPGRRRHAGGLQRQRRRLGRRLRGRRRDRRQDPRAGLDVGGQDAAEPDARRRRSSSSPARGRRPPTRPCASPRERFYASHNWHPFFLQGTKLIAYEIWEDLGFRAPDAVLIAGRRRQPRARLLDRLQRAAARRARSSACRGCCVVQPENCSPLARAFASGRRRGDDAALGADDRRGHLDRPPGPRPRGARGGARERRHDRGRAGGARSPPRCARSPPTASTPSRRARSWSRRCRGCRSTPGETVVTVLTGSGLKSAATMARILG